MFWIIIILTFGISMWASARVQSQYKKYSQVGVSSRLSGAEVASEILNRSGVRNVDIVAKSGNLIDHYDPMRKRLVLSEANYYGRSLAAVGIAAHEAGHAIQHAKSYLPLHLRMAVAGATGFASQIVLWLPIFGMFTGMLYATSALWIMAIGWGIIMAFNLITLPVEYDASARAKRLLLSMGIVNGNSESRGVGSMLNAAALTYVAAFLTSLAYLLLHLLPLLSGRNDE